jgi:hypothetical protein
VLDGIAGGGCMPVDPGELLAVWERGVGHAVSGRDDALLSLTPSGPGADTLGERNARLLDLHAHLFGPRLELRSRCAECGAVVEFACEIPALLTNRQPHQSTYVLESHGCHLVFRLPTSDDVIAATGPGDDDDFARRLVDRCVVSAAAGDRNVAPSTLSEDVLSALSDQMELLDPTALVSFSVQCPGCQVGWSARLDVGEVVWQRVRASAEQLLIDIDLLAHRYGWTEQDVLGLSPMRRAAYVQMARG